MGVKHPIAWRRARHATWVVSLSVAVFGHAQLAKAQGGGAVLPLSAVSLAASADIPFTVYNYGDSDLDFRIDPVCDLDGTEKTGEDCFKVFSLSFDVEMKNGIIRVPKGGRANATVKLLDAGSMRFALFKPIVDPLFPQELGRNAVAFKINYQPGYLYILKPAEEKLQSFTFATSANKEQRRANFEFDISALTMPQEVNVSAKISDKASGKLIRFVPLVKNKIVDPRRKKLQVSSDFAPASSKGAVCAQLFVQSSSVKSSYRLDACEN
jgi:hypothetical protein